MEILAQAPKRLIRDETLLRLGWRNQKTMRHLASARRAEFFITPPLSLNTFPPQVEAIFRSAPASGNPPDGKNTTPNRNT
jgi:hypothetical protein